MNSWFEDRSTHGDSAIARILLGFARCRVWSAGASLRKPRTWEFEPLVRNVPIEKRGRSAPGITASDRSTTWASGSGCGMA